MSQNNLKSLLGKLQAMKQAEANSETVGTSHPIANVDDNTQKATEGSRSSENTSDTKELVGDASVENGSKPSSTVESPTPIGPITPKTTGEDPSNETDSVGSTKDDPGTSHPAKADDGQKYAGLSKLAAFEARMSDLNALGSAILNDIVTEKVAADQDAAVKAALKKAGLNQPAAPAPAAPAKADPAVEASKQAGYDLANMLGAGDVPVEDKRACDEAVLDYIKVACDRGSVLADSLVAYYQGLMKAAEDASDADKMVPGGEDAAKSDGAGSAPSAPPAAMGGDGDGDEGGQSISIEELLQLLPLLQQVQGGGGGMPPGGGDMPPAPVDAMMAQGGGAGGPPAGGGDDAAALQQVMSELGTSPEQVQQKMAAAAAKRFAGKKAAYRKQIQELLGRR